MILSTIKSLPKTVVLLLGLGLVYFAILAFYPKPGPTPFHSKEEMEMMMKQASDGLPVAFNSLFVGSGKCAGCHGTDPNGLANIAEGGIAVDPISDWRATMMANSAKDPFWKAKVSHEVAVNPDHQVALEDKCTSCHAPMGNFAAHFDGADHYSMADLALDSLGMDGVSCSACHQQDMRLVGEEFSGKLNFVEDTIYGPYDGNAPDQNPIFSQPMTSFVGFYPDYHVNVAKSESCAGCHSLVTETADLEGNLTGGEFVEQATYHEWLNSIYSTEDNLVECQECHMPRIDDPIIISSGYSFLEPRTPYGLHYLVGANMFMLELMRDNIDELGIHASEEDYAKVMDRTLDMLQQQSVDIELTIEEVNSETGTFHVELFNKAGHKFPSGYPARRSFVEFHIQDANGNSLFHSGKVGTDYEIEGIDAGFEPHHDIITDENQVQIYEMVMADVNGDVTTVLERADEHLKDNRLVPAGFSVSHETYSDTTYIKGLAETDANFNFIDGLEGSGTDRITYQVPMNGFEGEITVTARLWYQSAPPRYMEEMFAVDTPEINAFKEMYEATGADPTEVVSATDVAMVTSVGEFKKAVELSVYPNPTIDGLVNLAVNEIVTEVRVFDAGGRLVQQLTPRASTTQIQIEGAAGNYTLNIALQDGRVLTRQVVKR